MLYKLKFPMGGVKRHPLAPLKALVFFYLYRMLSIVKHILLVSVVISQCANPRLRQEWNQLGAAQKTKFLNALNALKARPKGDQGNPAAWNYEQFADSHNAVASDNHGKPQFFVWHREFTNQFENALQSVDPTVTVPYWDWRVDSQRPFQAAVFAPAAFGGDGNSAPTNCVNNGVANGWKFAGDTCLKRCFRRNTVFFSPEAVSSLISSSPNFASLRNNIENGPHAAVHAAVGGDCGHMNTMLSPYDPVI